jgi:hypothetical protein
LRITRNTSITGITENYKNYKGGGLSQRKKSTPVEMTAYRKRRPIWMILSKNQVLREENQCKTRS